MISGVLLMIAGNTVEAWLQSTVQSLSKSLALVSLRVKTGARIAWSLTLLSFRFDTL